MNWPPVKDHPHLRNTLTCYGGEPGCPGSKGQTTLVCYHCSGSSLQWSPGHKQRFLERLDAIEAKLMLHARFGEGLKVHIEHYTEVGE